MPMKDLIRKYDIPAPRYTSYPTVPAWSRMPTPEEWKDSLARGLAPKDAAWACYIHIPFCESLCTFCGCNNAITRDHSLEQPYVDLVLEELQLYLEQVPALGRRPLRQLHLGGGSPTFLSPVNLRRLAAPLLQGGLKLDPHFEASVEVDPRLTSREHLQALRGLGFNRLSLGVQDFTPEVQRLVNRTQPYAVTARNFADARELGFGSLNLDLIYGLPGQTPITMADSMAQTLRLRPDRIALYSFALVPWIKPQQRLFKDEDLPKAEAKRELYELGRRVLLGAGYLEVGMDHFALPEDALAKALQDGTLHRNFMGYTENRTQVLLGLGVSAISETPDCFHQDQKVFPKWQESVAQGRIPSQRGHLLTGAERKAREQILSFMTQLKAELEDEAQVADARQFLAPMLEDGLVTLRGRSLSLTPLGRPFLRNACIFFDQHLRQSRPQARVFSQVI
jgi:oxygen-independent coproporphyrinogen-3 oxidase